jgi:hypothetical protein
MFFNRLKEEIYNPQELAIVNAQEQIMEEIPEEEPLQEVTPVATTSSEFPPSISSPSPPTT